MPETTYRYRKHIFTMYKILIVVVPIMILMGVLLLIASPEQSALAIFIIAIGIFDMVLYRNMITTKIELRDIEMEYTVGKTIRTIRYQDILKLDSRSIRYTGGWMLIVPVEGKPIRLTVMIHDVGELIISLKEKFDNLGLSDRYDESKLASFYKTAVYSERSWIRGGKILPWLLLGILSNSIMTGVQVALLGSSEPLLFFIFGIIIGTVPFFYVEYGIYAKEIKKCRLNSSWDLPAMNPELDRKRTRFTFLWFWGLSLISMTLPWLLF